MKFLKKSFVVFIAMLLLVSCSGVFVMIHTCMGSKKTEVTFSDNHKCCSKKKKSVNSCNIERKCCNVDYQYHKLSVVSLPADDHITPDLFIAETSLINFNFNTNDHSVRQIDHSPPLLVQDFSIEFRQLLI